MDRRVFVRGLLATGSALPFGSITTSTSRAQGSTPKLSVTSRSLDINGKSAKVYGLGVEGSKEVFSLPSASDTSIDLANSLSEPTLVHWHGLKPQWQYDGVPDLPAPLLQPGETRHYILPGGAPGTHWMHAHTLQEQNLLAAPLIVRAPDEASRDMQEVVVLLHDFSFTPAAELLDRLKANGGKGAMGNMPMHHMGNMANMGNMAGLHSVPGFGDRGGMSHMMMGMDVNDIDYDAYLANDRTLRDPQTFQVEKGGQVRLRIINGATATGYYIDTGTLDGTLLAVDGQDVLPLKSKRFPISMGQRLDIALAIPKEGGAFPVFALREGAVERTGIVLATTGAKISKIAEKSSGKHPLLSLDLESRLRAAKPISAKQPDRAFLIGLMGNMQNYSWALNSDKSLDVKQGARVELEMRNMSMMTHPMHLHGHHFQVVAINGTRMAGAVRDTVLIPPMQSVTVAFDADNPGKAWPLHCHHLYHMATGMMTTINYEGA